MECPASFHRSLRGSQAVIFAADVTNSEHIYGSCRDPDRASYTSGVPALPAGKRFPSTNVEDILPGLSDASWCAMEGSIKERWLQLAELAAKEQDPVKLIELVEEINRALQEEEHRLKGVAPGAPTAQGMVERARLLPGHAKK